MLQELIIVHEHVLVFDCCWLFHAITNHFNFVVEGDEAKLALAIACRHCIDLTGHRLLTKVQAPSSLHRATDIDAEDDGDFVRLCLLGLSLLLLLFSILNLGSRFQDIGDVAALWQLLILNMNFILVVAEFAVPHLLLTFFHNCAGLVEDTFARSAGFCVASRKLASILKAIQGHLEDVCVKFNFDLLALRLGGCVNALTEVFADRSAVVLVTQIQVSIELVGVHLIRRHVPIKIINLLPAGTACLRCHLRLLLGAPGEEARDGGEKALLDLLLSGWLLLGRNRDVSISVGKLLVLAFLDDGQIWASLSCCTLAIAVVFGEGLGRHERSRLATH